MKLPELGENIEGGDVLRVMVKAGDAIKKDQPVLELETDKATIEVPSSADGVVKEIKVKQGEKVKVGQTIFVVDEAPSPSGNGGTATAAQGTAPAPAAAAPTGQAAQPPVRRSQLRFESRAKAEKRKAEVVEMNRPKPTAAPAPAPAASQAASSWRRRIDSCRAVRAATRARARRQHSGDSRLRPWWPHFDGRRDRAREAVVVGRRRWPVRSRVAPCRCRISASGGRLSASR